MDMSIHVGMFRVCMVHCVCVCVHAHVCMVCVCVRPEKLINIIISRDYWETIDVQTIIVMSISYILSKEIPSETRLCKSIWCQIQCLNCHKPEYRYMIC